MDRATERWFEFHALTTAVLAVAVNATAALLAVEEGVRGLAAASLMISLAMLATLLFHKSEDLLGIKYFGALMAYLAPSSIYAREPLSHPDVFYAVDVASLAVFIATFFVGAYRKS